MSTPAQGMTRRHFLATAAAAGLTGAARASAQPIVAVKPPNFVFIVVDQQNWDAIGAHGNPYVKTPNMDRLVQRGVSFVESHSTCPVCSPARSSMFTGRMASETGVVSNDRPIRPDIPNIGQCLGETGYDTFYCGKWHVPEGFATKINGFTILPMGSAQGDLGDPVVSRQCEAFLRNHDKSRPFFLTASFLQPHDICYWAIKNKAIVPDFPRFPQIASELPPLPPNHSILPKAPTHVGRGYTGFNDDQWRYYLYVYHRMVEMLDADVGRVLDAVEDAGLAEDTIIIYTSDHGDGGGRHMNVQKWYPYEEAVKVPLVLSCPARFNSGEMDRDHLVSGVDIVPTVCDFAGVRAPSGPGASLRPLLEGARAPWREAVGIETHVHGRTIRSAQYKYIAYKGDPVEMLFDMKADPWETTNLIDDPAKAGVITDHRRLMSEWEQRLSPADKPSPATVETGKWLKEMLECQYGPGVA